VANDLSLFLTLAVAVTLLVGLVVGMSRYIRRRKARQPVENRVADRVPPIPTVRRVRRDSMEEQASQLLRAIYDLVDGNSGQWVAVAEAAEKSDIPFTAKDYYPSFQYLKQSGLITTDNLVHNEVCKLTPEGVRVMEQVASSIVPSDSMSGPKGLTRKKKHREHHPGGMSYKIPEPSARISCGSASGESGASP
jgi:hypothetical protein